MNWQFLTILSVFLFSFCILLQRIVLKHKNISPITLAIFFQFAVAAIIAIYAALTNTLQFPNMLPLLPNLIIMTIFYGLGNVLLFKAIEKAQISLVAILFSTRAIFAVFLSTLILHEVFTINQIIGALLVLAGIVIVNLHGIKLQFGKGELYALIAALCFGAAFINDKILLNTFSVNPYLVLNFLFPALATAIIYPKFFMQGKTLLTKSIRLPFLLQCAIFSISVVALFTAIQIAPNVSQVAVINVTNVIVTVLLAVIFLKERNSMGKKILGALLAFMGLLLVI